MSRSSGRIVRTVALIAIGSACSSRPAPSPSRPETPPKTTTTEVPIVSKHADYTSKSDDQLLEHRVIRLRGPITEARATEIIAKLLFLQHEDARAPIVLLLESPGGGLAATFAIRDSMDQLALPIATHAVRAEGTALLLLAHGARGERTAATTAVLSFAQIDGGTADESSRATTLAVDALAKDTRQPAAAVERDMAASRRFDAASARAYGLIDRVED